MTVGTHLAYADMDLIRGATLGATNEDAAYPIERVQVDDGDSPVRPFKATTTATVITITLDAAGEPDGLAIVNHNLAGATVVLANDAGFSEAIAIPARTRSGLCVNAWFDMRGLANRLSANWTLTITNALVVVAIGRLVLIGSGGLQPAPFLVTTPRTRPERFTTSLVTFYGHQLIYDKGVRQRTASGRVIEDTHRVIAETAWEAAAGTVLPFLFLPDNEVNDAWWVRFAALEWTQHTPDISPTELTVKELPPGPHLYET
jgi:hypothetical protein